MSVSLVKTTRINYVHPDRVAVPAAPFVSAQTINYVHPDRHSGMRPAQCRALRSLSTRYGVPFEAASFHPTFDLPSDWVAGWIGDRIYVGASPQGDIHS